MKIAPLYHALARESWCEPRVVHTGQHYDRAMSDVFFEELGLPEPDVNLGVGSGSHGQQTAALLVALVGSMAVMLVTISLAHGLGPKSIAAILGTSISLLLVGGLATLFTGLTNLTGFSSEEATLIAASGADVSISGLLVAGILIGALGVLDDVTISQSSTVMALRASNPDQEFAALYRRAIDVGRDHVSATVNTLVLAYVGSSLPILLIFGSGELGLIDASNLEVVAKEIVATLVGSIGLIAAVPITTALAAWMAGTLAHDELREAAEGGHHH